MSGNQNLHTAKAIKNNEFLTLYEDIEKELSFYDESIFNGKTILCPCDIPYNSNFTIFFRDNFKKLGLKDLYMSCWHNGYVFQKDFVEVSGNGLWNQYNDTLGKQENKVWSGNGDFRSDEVSSLRDKCDIIITNPPFSLFREFFQWIFEKDPNKKFLIIGNMNAITYKEIFPYLQQGKIWIGGTGIHSISYWDAGNLNFKKFGNTCWFTNLPLKKPRKPLELTESISSAYRKYDNYDAIEVPKTKLIPKDYDGIMGVPLSYLDKHCPEQFEIVWQASGNTRASAPKEILKQLGYIKHPDDRGGCAVLDGERKYGRIFIRRKS